MAPETILVDMRHFNSVKVNQETRQLTFGGGCNWGEVYEVANPVGLEAVGGGYWGVGVGGWHTGGGYSWLSGKHGMGCDNGEQQSRVKRCTEYDAYSAVLVNSPRCQNVPR
jgi:FAD/FMN-containing dehydrogenase